MWPTCPSPSLSLPLCASRHRVQVDDKKDLEYMAGQEGQQEEEEKGKEGKPEKPSARRKEEEAPEPTAADQDAGAEVCQEERRVVEGCVVVVVVRLSEG